MASFGGPTPFPLKRAPEISPKALTVLILCTGNSARSILAGAILNREGAGRFRAFSAGSRPKGQPHPAAIALLRGLGYETDGYRSKSWNEFADANAPKLDFILTVCDAAAGEACPVWPGHPLVAHWGIPDPAAVEGSAAEKHAAFTDTYRCLTSRISTFVNLDLDHLDLAAIKQQLAAIGAMEGATAMAMQTQAA